MAKGGKAKEKPKKSTEKGKDKKDKSSKRSSRKTVEDEIDPEVALLWEENLKATTINDEKWKCNVTILLQSRSEYNKLIEWYEDCSKSGTRRVVKNIANTDLILELKLSQGKKGMTKFHPLQGVCTAAAKSLTGGKLPPDILAKLIKYKIIRFKEADLSSKRAQILEERELQRTIQKNIKMENEKGTEEESGGNTGTLEKKKKDAKGEESEKSGKGGKKDTSNKEGKGKEKDKKSETKGGKGKGKGDKGKKKDKEVKVKKKKESDEELDECWDGSNLVPIDTPEKWNTKLRKRGEDWKDSHQIDDAPKDGADLYVTLTGFYDPNLLTELIKVGVPVNAVVKLKLDKEEAQEVPRFNSLFSLEDDVGLENIPLKPGQPKRNASMLESSCGKDKKAPAGQRKTNASTPDEAAAESAEVTKFWTDMQEFNKERDNLIMLKDVALVNFPVPASLKIPTNSEELVANQVAMFDIVSHLLYDMERFSRQHTNYVRHVKIWSLEPIRTFNNLDGMDIYKTMVQLMPMECQPVSFILHCILEQVVSLCQETEVLEILPPQEVLSGNKSVDEGFGLQKGNLKDEINQKHKSRSDSSAQRTTSPTKEGINKGVLSGSRKSPSKDLGASKSESLSPRAKRSKERSKDIVSAQGGNSVSAADLPIIDTSKINMVQTTFDTRVKQLNQDYNLFQVPSIRAIKRDPLVILRSDAKTLMSYHVAMPEVDLASIFERLVLHGRMRIIWNKYKEQTLEEKLKHDFHIHQLWNCMEDRNLTLRMLKNHLHLLIFEKMEGNAESFEIDCNKAGPPEIRKDIELPTGSTTGFMKFTDKLFRPNKGSAGKALQRHSIQTPMSDVNESKHVSDKLESRSIRMEGIGEMFEDPDIICLTDPLKYVLTGIRPIKQRETVLDLHKYTVVEEFNSNIMLQNLVNAHRIFSSCIVQYYAPTDVILMNFHNGSKKPDLVATSWMGKLTTLVSFRDFCEFVYEEESEWLNKQEEEYQRLLKERKEKRKETTVGLPGEQVLPGNEQTLKTTICADEEFIKIGSIKHNEIIKKQLGEQVQEVEVEIQENKKGKGKGKGKTKGDKGKKEPKEKKVKEKKEKAKKDKSAKADKKKKDKSPAKSDKKNKETEDIEVDIEVEIPFVKRPSFRCAREGEPHAFEGYDLKTLRVQFDGQSTRFFSPDGTEVESEVRELLYSNCKLVKTSVQKRGHILFLYNTVKFDQPSIEKPFVFHMVSAHQCILAFGERQEKKPQRKPTIVVQPVNEDPPSYQPQSSPVKPPKEKGSAANRNESIITSKTDKNESSKGSKSKQSDKNTNQGTVIPGPATRKPSDPPVVEHVQVIDEAPAVVEQISWKYDFRASWPSGLVVETVVGSSEIDPFHMMQKYLQKGPECEKIRNEDHRVFLRNGTVLKFMNNGFVEVLCSDSTITVCKSFKKPQLYSRQQSASSTNRRPRSPECPEDVRMEGKEMPAGSKDARVKAESVNANLAKGVVMAPIGPPQMVVDKYHVITPTGTQFSVREHIDQYPNLTEATNDSPYKPIELVVNDKHEKFLLRRATDYELGEVFTRRGDGTNTLLMPDGKLIVVFPDGTRITTWYTLDEHPVTLEWTDEEMVAVITAIAKRQEEEGRLEEALDASSRRSSTGSLGEKQRKDSKGHSRKNSLGKHQVSPQVSQPVVEKREKKPKSKNEPQRKLSLTRNHSKTSSIDGSHKKNSVLSEGSANTREPSGMTIDPTLFANDEGFVSVRMDCCLEHPNYATVSYVGADRSAEIYMPYNMVVNVSADGLYSAEIDEKTQLEVQEDCITFNCFVCPNCSTHNRTTIDLSGMRPPSTQESHPREPTDAFCTTLDGWGNCHTITYAGSSSLVKMDETAEDGDLDRVASVQCLPPSSKWNKRRCFVVNRDLSGEEMIHGDDAKTYLTAAEESLEAAVVTDKVPNKSGLRYHTVLCPILKTESQKWLMEYKSKYILPHNMRKKHLRSTYGDPPCWYHPFPKQQTPSYRDCGRGDAEGEGEDLGGQHDMTLRILQEMASREQEDNVIATIHEGLIKYWNAAAEKFQEYVDHPAVDPRTEEEIVIEDQLLLAALGQATVSIPEMFRRRHKRLGPTFGAMERLQGRASAHAAFLDNMVQKRAHEEDEKEAYRAILRNRSIPPYFKSVSGESFLRVLTAMNSAISEAEERREELTERAKVARNTAQDLVRGIVDSQVGESEDVASDIMESVTSVTMDEIGMGAEFESKRTQTDES